MILSNTEIIRCINEGVFSINTLPSLNPLSDHFNTSSVDLRLGQDLLIPKINAYPINIDLTKASSLANYLLQTSDKITLTEAHPTYTLEKEKLILGQTMETVSFPLLNADICYSARVEGRSSLARCGILVHFTAPTIHAGFTGPITLEIINFGFADFTLRQGMRICQLIIEEVKGMPANSSNQYSGQVTPAGTK